MADPANAAFAMYYYLFTLGKYSYIDLFQER
jgi:hypothetical protein